MTQNCLDLKLLKIIFQSFSLFVLNEYFLNTHGKCKCSNACNPMAILFALIEPILLI